MALTNIEYAQFYITDGIAALFGGAAHLRQAITDLQTLLYAA